MPPSTQQPAPTQQQFVAAADLMALIIEKTGSGGTIHSETAIAAAAGVAGTFLLRSFRLSPPNAQPGMPLLSVQADESCSDLVDMLLRSIAGLGVPFDPANVPQSLPAGCAPRLSLPEVQALLLEPFDAIARQQRLTDYESAIAGAVACGYLIRDCASALDPHVAFVIACREFLAGAKTVPIASFAAFNARHETSGKRWFWPW